MNAARNSHAGMSLALALGLMLATPAALAQEAGRVRVGRIIVLGNTVLPADVIDEVVAPYQNRDLDADALEELRRSLTAAYVRHGYIAAGAILPEQDASTGTLTLQAVEGQAVEVNVTGTSWLGEAYVHDRLELATEAPLNIDTLRKRVAVMLQDPNIARLNVDVGPGLAPGDARVDAKVTETSPWSLFAGIANDQPPDVGALRGMIGGTLRNLLHCGDVVSLSYSRTAGANIANGSFEVPVTRYDTRVSLHWSYNGAGVVSAAFAGLGITSLDQSAGMSLIQPLVRSEHHTLEVSLSWDYTVSDQYLLGQPFSFAPGYVNGHAESAAVRAAVDWSWRTEAQAVSLRGTVSHGLNMFGATNEPNPPNADFISGLGQGYYVAHLADGLQLIGRGAGQLASQPLYSFEKIAIGGPSTVRGYVQNALVCDSAIIGSVELRQTLGHLAIPGLAGEDGDGAIDLALFVDGGRGWNRRGAVPTPDGIASVGAGFRWEVRRGLTANVYYGYPLISPHTSVPLLQPISFGVTLQI